MLKYFLISILIAYTFCNTRSEAFVQTFKPNHIKEGDNKNFPPAGSQVTVHYTGTFPDSGKKFDSSVDRGNPFTFTIKRGQVIQCWDEVVSNMSLGEKISVICPSKLAYGERGAGGVIPANADIAFEIELLKFTGSGDL
jgi:FKBP-type peptidyl-prolyl cis-trans isomerase